LQIKNFKDYVELYLKDKEDENGQPLKIVHEIVSDRWEIALTMSEKGFQQVSFVNSVATTKVGISSPAVKIGYITFVSICHLLCSIWAPNSKMNSHLSQNCCEHFSEHG